MFTPDPIGLPGLAAFLTGAFLFVFAVVAARFRRQAGGEEAGATRSGVSRSGVVVQGLGISWAGFGRQRVTLDPLSTKALVEAAAVAVLMLGAVTLFVWASRTMGRNWSIVARTRADHTLVQDGPFRYVRHPIYTGMLLFMLGLAIAFGHTRQLLIGVPLFALGTWIRIANEERLLRTMFGSDYDAYALRVKRFVPGLLTALTATLERLAQALAGAAKPWWIIGSAAVVLHGGAIEPIGDVDVLLAATDAQRLLPALGLLPAPGMPDLRFRSDLFARWSDPPVPVEFMAGLAVRHDGGWAPVQLRTRTALRAGDAVVFAPSRSELVQLLHHFGRAKDLRRAAVVAASPG